MSERHQSQLRYEQWNGQIRVTRGDLEQKLHAALEKSFGSTSNVFLLQLFAAIERQDIDNVQQLLKTGIPVNGLVHGCTPLGKAAQRGHTEIVNMLIHGEEFHPVSKCDIDCLDFYERTALMYAAENGQLDAVKLLIKAGCSVNKGDTDGATALHTAACQGHEDVIEELLKSGANSQCTTSATRYAYSERLSPLHCAAGRGYTGIVTKLLEYGAKANAMDTNDRTPLHIAVNRGHRDIVAILLQHGAEVNWEHVRGYTPLYEAVYIDDVEIVRMLLEAGAVIRHNTLLQYAIFHKNLELVKLLIEAGCNVNQVDNIGETPMHAAVKHSVVPIIEYLIAFGCDVNTKSAASGATPLHQAVRIEMDFSVFQIILNLLLQAGCDLNAETFEAGKTPLYIAIMQSKLRIAKELVRRGTDVNGIRHTSRNYLHCSWYNGHYEILKYLVLAGYNLQNEEWLFTIVAKDILSSQMNWLFWLREQKHNPLSLMNSCRISLRRGFSTSGDLFTNIEQLPLPNRLKGFLKMEDLE